MPEDTKLPKRQKQQFYQYIMIFGNKSKGRQIKWQDVESQLQ
jgi:hypothetical protein